MLEPQYNSPIREEWDEHDWERFLQRADVRTAKFQELFETLLNHPDRDRLIAHDMGWQEMLDEHACGDRDCAKCDTRFECEAYEMLRLMSEPDNLDEDPDAADLIACFEQVRGIPAYQASNDFAAHLEETLRQRTPEYARDNDVRNALLAAQMAPAQVAGGHGIGYERDAICGNIANCKRALRSISTCMDHLGELARRSILPVAQLMALQQMALEAETAIHNWVGELRTRIWWQ